jgi:hypothetical protein
LKQSVVDLGRRSALLGEYFGCDVVRFQGSGDTAVDRDLQQDFANLVLAAAVLQRTAQVDAQLVRPVQRARHGQREQAAHLAGNRLAPPDLAIRILIDQLLQRRAELAGGCHAPCDDVGTEHLFANAESLLVHVVVVHCLTPPLNLTGAAAADRAALSLQDGRASRCCGRQRLSGFPAMQAGWPP